MEEFKVTFVGETVNEWIDRIKQNRILKEACSPYYIIDLVKKFVDFCDEFFVSRFDYVKDKGELYRIYNIVYHAVIDLELQNAEGFASLMSFFVNNLTDDNDDTHQVILNGFCTSVLEEIGLITIYTRLFDEYYENRTIDQIVADTEYSHWIYSMGRINHYYHIIDYTKMSYLSRLVPVVERYKDVFYVPERKEN